MGNAQIVIIGNSQIEMMCSAQMGIMGNALKQE